MTRAEEREAAIALPRVGDVWRHTRRKTVWSVVRVVDGVPVLRDSELGREREVERLRPALVGYELVVRGGL
jgi:hypothetical protein